MRLSQLDKIDLLRLEMAFIEDMINSISSKYDGFIEKRRKERDGIEPSLEYQFGALDAYHVFFRILSEKVTDLKKAEYTLREKSPQMFERGIPYEREINGLRKSENRGAK